MAPQFEFRFWLEADLRRRILDGVVAPGAVTGSGRLGLRANPFDRPLLCVDKLPLLEAFDGAMLCIKIAGNPDNFSSPGPTMIRERGDMPIYMWQGSYTGDSWAAQMKNPQNRVDAVGKAACEAVGGRLIGGWYAFGEYDIVIVADVPNPEAMAAIAIALGAGGAVKSAKTTVLMSGASAVTAITKANDVAKVYQPAR